MTPQNSHDIRSSVRLTIKTGTGEAYSKEMSSVEHSDSTFYLLSRIVKDKNEAYYLIVPFIFSLCAYLEATLNDHLIIKSFRTHGLAEYKSIAEGYIGISLAKKMRITVAFLSDNAFQLREDSQTVQELNRLISVRNKLTHAQSFFIKDHFPRESKSQISSPSNSSIYIPTVKDCRVFITAFTEFGDKFFQPYREGQIEENDLIRASETFKTKAKNEETGTQSEE